jgi:hypothetical protein
MRLVPPGVTGHMSPITFPSCFHHCLLVLPDSVLHPTLGAGSDSLMENLLIGCSKCGLGKASRFFFLKPIQNNFIVLLHQFWRCLEAYDFRPGDRNIFTICLRYDQRYLYNQSLQSIVQGIPILLSSAFERQLRRTRRNYYFLRGAQAAFLTIWISGPSHRSKRRCPMGNLTWE